MKYTVTPHNRIEFMRKFVISRADVYARQEKTGRYIKVDKPLTDAALLRHLEHKVTLGTYTTDETGHCKTVLWDIDNHEGEEIIPADIVVRKVRKLSTTLKSFEVPHTLAESSPGSYHICVYFDPPAKTEEAYDFGQWVLRNADIGDVECFPKQRTVPPGDYGNLIRLNDSIHQRKRTKYSYIDDNFNPIDTFDVDTMDISGFHAPSRKRLQPIQFRPQISSRKYPPHQVGREYHIVYRKRLQTVHK